MKNKLRSDRNSRWKVKILRQIERENFVYYAVIVVSSENREPQKYMKEYTFGQRKHDERAENKERETLREEY